jgi:opacity protein-like surface antigen
MKAILVAIAVLPVTTLAANTADVSRGAVELSGDTALSFSTGSTKVKPDAPGATEVETDTTVYGVDAAAFYYVVRNVGLGLSIHYENEKEETGASDERAWTLLLGPAISGQLPVAPGLAVFGRGTFGYAASRSWGEDLPDLKGTGYGFALEAGAKYFPMAQLSLNLGVGYAYAKLTTDETTTPTTTVPEIEATSSGITVFAGLSVYLGR